MKPRAAPRPAGAVAWHGADWRHGARLAIAVVVAYTASTSCALPESFWAVMSALIVVRPTAGSTLGAGWDRVRGTISGTVIGLAGVWLHQAGLGSHVTTLAIIAILAFLSALVPAMRSAPISALIILDSGGIAGHSALDVAGLRAIEIAIGVATGVVISLVAFATHARERFADAAADWLRDTARQTLDDLADGEPDGASRDERREKSRAALRRIAELAAGADREARWLVRPGRRDIARIDRAACARLLTRISHDVGSVVRAAGCAPTPLDDAARRALADAVSQALTTTADALVADPSTPSPGHPSLKRWATSAETPVAWVAAPAHLLLQDLRGLRRLAAPAAANGR